MTSARTRGWARALAPAAALSVAAACAPGPAAEPLPVLPIGGDFQLTDHDNRPFDLASLRGRVVLIFFGYSSCPDACPTTLSKLATVARRLGDDRARVKTLYISVDPERDTPPVLKEDLEYFALDALGLTGTKDQIDKVVGQYGAAYEVVPTPGSAAKYTVSHSTAVYALDAKGRVRTQFVYEASVDEIVKGIQAILADAS
ncbi:MAG: SCO family protein [Acidobacteria bacterium]|nr:SCO family protein [Acidobacteriota bacterium]